MSECQKCRKQFDPSDSLMGGEGVCEDCWEAFTSHTWWQAINGEKLSTLDEWQVRS